MPAAVRTFVPSPHAPMPCGGGRFAEQDGELGVLQRRVARGDDDGVVLDRAGGEEGAIDGLGRPGAVGLVPPAVAITCSRRPAASRPGGAWRCRRGRPVAGDHADHPAGDRTRRRRRSATAPATGPHRRRLALTVPACRVRSRPRRTARRRRSPGSRASARGRLLVALAELEGERVDDVVLLDRASCCARTASAWVKSSSKDAGARATLVPSTGRGTWT